MASCKDPTTGLANYPIRYDENTVIPYIVDRSGGKNKNVHTAVVIQLRYNRMGYCKDHPGDCGSSPGSGGISAYGIAQSSLGIGGAGLGIAGATGAVAAGTAAMASLVLAPVGVIIGVFSQISAHHKQAVATEQATLCQVVNAFNQVMDNIEPAIASGKLSLQQAVQYLQNAHDQLATMLQSIENHCNAACFYHSVLDSLLAFNKKYVFPSLLPNQTTLPYGAPNVTQSPAAKAAVTSAPGSTPNTSSPLPTVAAVGLIGAKLAGVY